MLEYVMLAKLERTTFVRNSSTVRAFFMYDCMFFAGGLITYLTFLTKMKIRRSLICVYEKSFEK